MTQVTPGRNDYDSNARGEVTPQQREALIARYDRSIIAVVAWFILLGVGAVGIALLSEADDLPEIWSFLVIGGFIVSLIGLMGAMSFIKARYTIPTVERLMSEPLLPGSGTLEWDERRVIARINDRTYHYIYGDEASKALEAGVYSFYYQDDPNWVYSVQRLGHMPETLHNEALTCSVARIRHFVGEALPVNRAGRLNAAQRWRVLGHGMRTGIGAIGGLIGVLGLAGYVGVILFLSFQKDDLQERLPQITMESIADDPQVQSLVGAGVFILIVLASMLLWIFRRGRHFLQLAGVALTGRVHHVDGEVTHETRVDSSTGSDDGETLILHYYVIAGKYFLVSRDAHDALPEGRRVRAYYLPDSQFYQLIPYKTIPMDRRRRFMRMRTKRTAIRHYVLVNLEVL